MKKIFVLISFLLIAGFTFSQYSLPEKEKISWQERIRFGGGLGLGFGNITRIDISPRISYMIHPRLFAGVGGSYLYYKNSYYSFETHMYGFSAFTNYALIQDFGKVFPIGENSGSLILYAETNMLNLDPEMDFTKVRDKRFWLFQPMAGGGFKIPAGIRSYALILILYNFNEQLYSPAQNPVISVSLMF